MSAGQLLMLLIGDCREVLKTLPEASVNCAVTSPPYWGLRDYGVPRQIGLEATPELYVETMREVFQQVWRVLRDDGTLWLNLGDSYISQGGMTRASGHNANCGNTQSDLVPRTQCGPRAQQIGYKTKDLVGIPWRVAFALQADGWYLRSDIIWHKPNPMPESVTDRPTKSHEYLFLMSKQERYYYDAEVIKEKSEEASGWANQRANGKNTWEYNDTPHRIASTGQTINGSTFGTTGTRNKRSVWTVPTSPYGEAHFATFPPDLIKPCILAGCPVGGAVLDLFAGSGTTGMVAIELGRRAVLIEMNPDYVKLCDQRCAITPGLPLT